MDIEPSFETNAYLSKAGKPSVRALNHPPVTAQALPALDALAGDPGPYAVPLKILPTSAAVVSLVGMQLVGALTRPAIQATYRGNRIQGGFECDRVMSIRPCYGDGQGNASGIDYEVPLAPEFAAIRRARPGLFAPGAGHACPVDTGPTPINLVVLAQSNQHGPMQLVPHAVCLPVSQAAPAGHAAAKAKFLGKVFPRNTRMQHIQDAAQRCTIIDRAPPATFGRGDKLRDQRLQRQPQLFADFSSRHASYDNPLLAVGPVMLAALIAQVATRLREERFACLSPSAYTHTSASGLVLSARTIADCVTKKL